MSLSLSTLATNIKPIQESRVAIIGGSIGGCAAAIALQRAGVPTVDIFERSSQRDLADRGLGIGLPTPVFQTLVNQNMVDADLRFVQTQTRHWILKDSDSETEKDNANNSTYRGKVSFVQPMQVQLHNWGLLWQQLRKRVPEESYHAGIFVDIASSKVHKRDSTASTVELFQVNKDDKSTTTSLGEYDFCIQAEGALAGSTTNPPKYAGYVLWRGSFPVKDYPAIDLTDMPETFMTPVYPNGHGIVYLMPTSCTDTDGDYLMNFAIYTHTPPGLEGDYLFKVTRASQLTADQLEWFDQHALSAMPPRFKDIVQVCIDNGSIAIHPILDRIPASFATMEGLGLKLGDAGAVLRPHTGSGTTKAILEALTLQKLASAPDATWQTVSQAYQDERLGDARTKVALGERLGRAQVLETPDWADMEPQDYEDWLASQVASEKGHYMYKDLKKTKQAK